MNSSILLSVQVADVKEIATTNTSAWWDKSWTTGFYKKSVAGPLWLGYEGLRDDQQADRRHHGGVDKAVCVYAGEHYPYWRETLALPEMTHGAFGENFTVKELTEPDACVGDIYEIGEAQVQISQPRQPCWKLSRRWRVKDLTAQVEQNGRTGYYFRVLRHGWVTAGTTIRLIDRPFPKLTIAYANQVMHHRKEDFEAARELSACPALSASWKDALWLRAEKSATTDISKRTQQP